MGGHGCAISTLDLLDKRNNTGRIDARLSQINPKRRITLKIDTIDPILARKLNPR